MNLRERLGYVRVAKPVEQPRRRAPILPPTVKRSETALGDVYYAEQFWPLDYMHGCYALQDALQVDDVALARLTETWTADDVSDAAFIDIETTGLSGGTGTYAFLVGVGSFEGYSFRVRQYFLADPSGETAMLAAIAETIARKTRLVSFNGRTFDVPQLATRYALRRLPGFDTALPHLDLLFPSRRLYGRRLDSCRLGALEEAVLGLKRDDDVPSWLIPSLYFSYIRYGRAQGLHPVFLHNALDVVSLVTCLAHLGKVAGKYAWESADAEHLLALGRWDDLRGDGQTAQELLAGAVSLDSGGLSGAEAIKRLARLHRRDKDWDTHESVWLDELARTTSPVRRVVAGIELAKIYEHRLHDPQSALVFATAAYETLQALPRYQRPLEPTLTEIEKRLNRLRTRLARRQATSNAG